MTKATPLADRRSARLAEIAAGSAAATADARKRVEAAVDHSDPAVADAALNHLTLLDAADDLAALIELAARVKAHADNLIPTGAETGLWIAQTATLVQVSANLKTIGDGLLGQTRAVVEAA